jgi:cytochrome c-type biogenesis protein CcmH/NrfG
MPNPPPPSLAKKLGCLLVALGLFALVAKELQYSLAAQYGRSSDRYLRMWNNQKQPPSQQQWQQGLSQAKVAVKYNPYNPDNSRRLGRIYEWGQRLPELDASAQRINTRTAKIYYQQVLKQRPTWGWDWYRLYRVKARLAEIDTAATDALNQAAAAAPNDSKLLLNIVYYGLKTSDNQSIAQLVVASTKNLLINSPRSHYKLAKHYKRLQLLPQLCDIAAQLNVTSPALNKNCW